MSVYDTILFGLLVYFAVYLSVMGWFGFVIQSPLVHRCPYTFHRPTIYLLVLGLLFMDHIEEWFGAVPALVVFCLLAVDFVYETIHPFISHSVEITSASRQAIERDLIDALEKLTIRHKGKFPRFQLPDHKARLRVRHWPRFGKAELTIYPITKMDLLLKISVIV